MSENCTVKSVGPQCLALLGYTAEELLGKDCRAFIHEDDRESVLKMRKLALGRESLNTMEYRLRTKSGKILRVVDHWIAHRVPEDGFWIMEGQLTESEGVLKNKLTNQIRAYRDAVDVNMISSITDPTGKIIYVNENFCRISKYSVTELVGRNHRIIRSGHHPPSFFADMWETISSGKLWHGEIMNRAKDGSLYWVDTVIIPMFDDQGRIDRYLSLRMLITDRKRSEEQRTKYTDSLERIAFMVAHDIRGPLCNIMGLTNILTNPNANPQDTRVALGYLRHASSQLDKITRKLSRFVFENEIELKASWWQDRITEDHDYVDINN